MRYFQPIVQTGPVTAANAAYLAGGPLWFSNVLELRRDAPPLALPLAALPADAINKLSAPRGAVCGLSLDQPRLMGVLNVTPDSFSDGGRHNTPEQAVARAHDMCAQGAHIIDIGGESTRPGADYVKSDEERARVLPVISALAQSGVPISVDTRKAGVARAALEAGAGLFNDVTALSFDPQSLPLVAEKQPFVCLMHASGDPKTMQDDPQYDDVVLDVFDYLAARVQLCIEAGLPRERIIVDPGIGFGKTMEHNLLLLRHLSLFHALGCAVLLGVSRKRFIGTITNTQEPADRAIGSVAVALEALRQGVQIIRAHDIGDHARAFAIWQALWGTTHKG